MTIDKKALKILSNYDILNPNELAKEDFYYAKDAGYMFDPVKQAHDAAVKLALQELSKCDKKHITDLFLSSLSCGRFEWRSGLPAYAIIRVFPEHSIESNGSNCVICGSFPEQVVDFSFINQIRFFSGGIIDDSIYALAFILQKHNTLPYVKPKAQDFDIFKSLIKVFKMSDGNHGPTIVQKAIRKIEGFKSNEEQRKCILETFGFCSILETEKHRGLLNNFTPIPLAPASRLRSDWKYPVDWWKGQYGVNQDALTYWFGDYKELDCLFE